jgi:hypothetical protein
LGLKVNFGKATDNEKLMYAALKAKSAPYKTEFTRLRDDAIGDPRSIWRNRQNKLQTNSTVDASKLTTSK